MDTQKAKGGNGAQGTELETDTEKQEQGDGGGEIQLLQILKVQACVSLTLLRALILALRRNCCIKVTWGCKRETIILSSLKHLLSFYHGGQDFGQIVPTRSDLRIVP